MAPISPAVPYLALVCSLGIISLQTLTPSPPSSSLGTPHVARSGVRGVQVPFRARVGYPRERCVRSEASKGFGVKKVGQMSILWVEKGEGGDQAIFFSFFPLALHGLHMLSPASPQPGEGIDGLCSISWFNSALVLKYYSVLGVAVKGGRLEAEGGGQCAE
eukprot:347662-Amorphochlora_amoeboformis.AAC.1